MDPITATLLASAVQFALTEAYAVWKAKGGEPLTGEEVAALVARSQQAVADADDRLQNDLKNAPPEPAPAPEKKPAKKK